VAVAKAGDADEPGHPLKRCRSSHHVLPPPRRVSRLSPEAAPSA
jgi:hypothetical protein